MPALHSPLPDPAKSIRLLSIEPGWPHEALIRTRLLVVPDRANAPSYEALSYVWGDVEAGNLESIRCNGHQALVTPHLAAALRALRPLPPATGPASGDDLVEHGVVVLEREHVLHSYRRAWKGIARHRYEREVVEARRAGLAVGNEGTEAGSSPGPLFWIDAICINQNDMQECAEQVKTMRSIYSAAVVVRIWLGQQLVAASGAPLRLSAAPISKLDTAMGRVRLADLGLMPVVLSFLVQALRNEHRVTQIAEDRAEVEEIGFPPRESAEYGVLAAFFDQPWFRRVWIVQEAVSARDARITVGNWELDWEPFARAVAVLGAASLSAAYSVRLRSMWAILEENTAGLELSAARYLCDIRRVVGRRKHLLPLLSDSRMRRAKKPADHVFAVLGMAEELSSPSEPHLLSLLAIDYTKPVARVFRDATWFIVLAHNTLRPLTMAELTEERPTADLPSWVPDWSQPRRTIRLFSESFDASAGQKARLELGTVDVLRVYGHRLGAVGQLTEMLAHAASYERLEHSWHYPPHQPEKDFVAAAWALARSARAPDGEPKEEESGSRLLAGPAARDGLDAFIYTLSGNRDETAESGRADSSTRVVDSGRAWLQTFADGFPSAARSLMSTLRNAVSETLFIETALDFQICLIKACSGRRFFLTNEGYMGIGPGAMQQGDIVVIILGLPVPLVVRQTIGEPASYLVVGECYVHGIMDGEWVQARMEAGEEAELWTLL